MDNYFEEFRLNLKYYRELKGWTQSELAIQVNSSKGTIGNIESGKAKPSFDIIISLATALEIHPADLFLRDSSKESELRPIIHKILELPSIKPNVTKRLLSDIYEMYQPK